MISAPSLCRMWCANTGRHEPHVWGVRGQHFCDGKRAKTKVKWGRA